MKIAEVLMRDGIMPNIKGFDFLIKAIEYTQKNPNPKICKLYADIGFTSQNQSSKSVEKAIRHAISHSSTIKAKIESSGSKPNNSTYISYVAYCLSNGIEIF